MNESMIDLQREINSLRKELSELQSSQTDNSARTAFLEKREMQLLSEILALQEKRTKSIAGQEGEKVMGTNKNVR